MRDHSVQLYETEDELGASLLRFALGGLALGEGVGIIASPERWQALTGRLRGAGVDTHNAVLRGQLRLFASRVILSSCMSKGVPERRAFNEAIGGVLGLMRTRYSALRVFDGLTDELWAAGRRDAAEAVERFWNALPAGPPLSLLCACPLDSLDGRAYEGALQRVCSLHTQLLPASDTFNEVVSAAVREVLEPRLVHMLHALSSQQRPGTQMPPSQAVMFWLRRHMPRTAERVLARARART